MYPQTGLASTSDSPTVSRTVRSRARDETCHCHGNVLRSDVRMVSTPSPATPILETVEAETFLRQMEAGRNRAVALGCHGAEDVTCVVKLPTRLQGMAPYTYLVEWYAAEIARALGILVPRSFCVRITPPFAQSVAKACTDMTQSVGDVFGSEFCRGFAQWPRNSLIPIEMRAAAAEIVAFDSFVHNIDRRAANPNLLAAQECFLAFDHDQAFSFIWDLSKPKPQDALLDALGTHAFAGGFGRKAPSLARFRVAVEALDLPGLASGAPLAWQSGVAAGKLVQIVAFMQERQQAVDVWLPQVEAWINR